MSTHSLADLPSELLCHIFTFLPSQSVISCLRVNQRFNRIIEENRKIMAREGVNLKVSGGEEVAEISLIVNNSEKALYLIESNETTNPLDMHDVIRSYLNNLDDIRGVLPSILTDDVNIILRDVLSFIMVRGHINNLRISLMTSVQLQIITEALLQSKCQVQTIRLETLKYQLDSESSKILDSPKLGLLISEMRYDNLVAYVLNRDSVTRLAEFCFSAQDKDETHRDISCYVRELQASELIMSRPHMMYIGQSCFTKLLEEWATGSRTILSYTLMVKFVGDLESYVKNLSFLSIAKDSGDRTFLVRPSDGETVRISCNKMWAPPDIYAVQMR